MRCAICDHDDDSVTHLNTDCPSCQAVITDTINSYDKLDDDIDDDDFEEPLIEEVEYDDETDYGDPTY